jgi:hypothetical protein
MKRMFAFVAAAALSAGCQSPQPAYNPFNGPTVVPPPGTATPPPGQPYYGSPPGAPLLPPTTNVPPPTSSTIRPGAPNFAPVPAGGMSSSFTPNVSGQSPAPFAAPASAAPISASLAPVPGATAQSRPVYGPPGGNALPQRIGPVAGGPTVAQAPTGQPTLAQSPSPPGRSAPAAVSASSAASSNTQTAAAASGPATGATGSSAARGTVTPASFTTPSPAIRIVDPPAASSSALSATTPQGTATSGSTGLARIPEIGELPAFSGRSATAAASPPVAAAPTLARAGAAPSGTGWNRPSAVPPTSDQPAAGFGYDPQYRWLKGKLEYSQATQTWRLRYIPPDGATDNYGGSVILSDAARLGGLKPGDLVYAEGTPGTAGATTGSFAPIYALQRIAKQ